MEAIPDVYCVTVDCNDVFRHRCVQTLFYKIPHKSITVFIHLFIYFFFNQIALEGIKGATGFVALDDIEYTPGVNCDNQLVDPKPGEMHQWLNSFFRLVV